MELKATARRIFEQTLAGIDVAATLDRKLERRGSRIRVNEQVMDLAEFERIVVIAVGKAGFAMTRGLLSVFGPKYPAGGILSVPSPPPAELPGFEIFLAGHPVPNEASLAAGAAALHLLEDCDEKTLVFFLLSGGGSALLEQPLDAEAFVEDVQAIHRALVTCGAPIHEMNAVRKHLSAVKGGRLAAAAPRAMKITLGISDVPAGHESALASGPTLPDPTRIADALAVVERYALRDRLPPALHPLFDPARLEETPKPGDPAFARSLFQIVLGMEDLFESARRAAEQAGFLVVCDNATDDWRLPDARDFLLDYLAALKEQNPGRAVCLVADGELSSPVTGKGIGGRNSAFVLSCVERIAGQDVAVLSAGTDGADGNSPAAGAVADGATLERARAAGLDPDEFAQRSDSYSFFKRLEDAVETGPTGNNLRDLRILLHG